tara:strand:+ start:560 stop:1867 length:1308 start_codon:yes stop_codon:yes gene_type:complete
MANSYLQRTLSSGNRKKFTISAWVKRSKLGAQQIILNTQDDGSNQAGLQFLAGDTLNFYSAIGGTYYQLVTNRVFRDPHAWYHIVAHYDTTDSTQGDRIKLYVNGVRETSFSTETYPTQDYDTFWNQNKKHQIGAYGDGAGLFFEGYMSHVAFVDNAALTPTSFGETESTSGIWKFKTPAGITWGTNGFHIKFENSGNLGLDSSGNSNNFTTNGGLTQSVDTPSINWVTFSPLFNSGSGQVGYERANTRAGTSGGASYLSMFPTTGKWFYEFHFNAAGSNQDNGVGFWSVPEAQTINFYTGGFKGIVWKYAGNVYVNGSNNAISSDSWTSGDIISIAMDMDNSTVTFYKNGSAATNLSNYSFPFTEREAITVGIIDGASASAQDGIFDFNSGANGTFGGRKTAGGNSDANGQGNFSMAVPSGYYALNTKNLNTYG